MALAVAMSVLACGQEFTGVQDGLGGAGGSAQAGAGGSAQAGASDGEAGSAALGGEVSGAAPVASDAQVPRDGLELWLRADQGVQHVSGLVSSWKDASPHARDALQLESELRPKLVDGALSGKPALVFDGNDDFLELPALSADLSHGVSMFIALEQESVGSCGAWFEASNGRELQELHFGDWQKSVIYEIAESWLNDTKYPLLMGAPQITSAVHGADARVALRTNGSNAGSGVVKLSPPDLSRKYVYVGKTLYTDCAFFRGSIGEVLLYSRAVTSQELLAIEGYLQAKWSCCQ